MVELDRLYHIEMILVFLVLTIVTSIEIDWIGTRPVLDLIVPYVYNWFFSMQMRLDT